MHIAEQHLAMPVDRQVVHDGQVAQDAHAGCVQRYQQHRMALVRGAVLTIVRDTHHDHEAAVWMHRPGGEPFAPVDHVTDA